MNRSVTQPAILQQYSNQSYHQIKAAIEERRAVSEKEFEAIEKWQEEQDRARLGTGFGAALLEWNEDKNRYSNNLPLDATRVVLPTLPGILGSDYINASHIKSTAGGTRYIASQAPLPNTVGDFWRMVYEEKVRIVVMVTQLVEDNRVKCAPYWPQTPGTSGTFANLRVSLEEEKAFPTGSEHFVVRKLRVEPFGKPSHSLVQIHYKLWPDFGCPNIGHICDIFRVIERMEQQLKENKGPILVHCSAGLGRTGCMIACHIFLEWCKNFHRGKLRPDICAIVKDIRSQRPGLVQTPEQYHFIREFARLQVKKILLEKNKVATSSK